MSNITWNDPNDSDFWRLPLGQHIILIRSAGPNYRYDLKHIVLEETKGALHCWDWDSQRFDPSKTEGWAIVDSIKYDS